MTEEEIKEITRGIASSPDFLSALQTCYENMPKEGEKVEVLALWFFSQGYLSCLDYMAKKDLFRPISLKDSCLN
jgi:hypothetical protein